MSMNLVNVNAERTRLLTQRYGKKVDRAILYSHGVYADIYLNARDMLFSGEVSGKTVQNRDGTLVKKEMLKLLAESVKVKWVPLIIVTVLDNTSYGHGSRDLEPHRVILDYMRCWAGKLPNMGLRSCMWDTPESERLARTGELWIGRFDIDLDKLPATFGTHHVLLYNDTMWQALVDLGKRIDTLHGRLNQLLASPDGHAKLVEMAGLKQLDYDK